MRNPTTGTLKHFGLSFDKLMACIWDSLMEELAQGVDIVYEWEQTYYAEYARPLDLNTEFRRLLSSSYGW